ncbi:MAG: hypothetical protein KGD73_13010, partial [Candidatus Lokiarchaeota archaeon]|nr:hypothetical protein [Candidatus Lokiarchaeota archaeon]
MTVELTKQNWIVRATNIFNSLDLNILHSTPEIRNFLRENFSDSISIPTTSDLLSTIIISQENGMQFIINSRTRKLIQKETKGNTNLYE